jgi:hypothetical protein
VTAAELLEAFAAGERSPVEALEDCVAAIDPDVGAFAALCLG